MTGDDRTLPRLVGLVGQSGAGKDVVASILGARWGYQRVAIADPIKKATAVIFDLDREQLWGDMRNTTVERTGLTPRQAFQRVGDGVRHVDPSFWLHLFERQVERLLAHGGRVVCTDVRTRAEIYYVKNRGGVVWHLSRPEAGAPGAAGCHSTETELAALPSEEFDAVIVNDSPRATLIRRCEGAMLSCSTRTRLPTRS